MSKQVIVCDVCPDAAMAFRDASGLRRGWMDGYWDLGDWEIDKH
jgi:hypothetical protein